MKMTWKGWLWVSLLLLCAPVRTPAAITIFIYESGGDVIARYQGSVNLDGLTFAGSGLGLVSRISASVPFLQFTGIDDLLYDYPLPGPEKLPAFGGGGEFNFSAFAGDPFIVYGGSLNFIMVSAGYVSGTWISGSMRANGQTLASLGITPGVYSVNWGSGPTADSVTLIAGTEFTSMAPISSIESPGLVRFNAVSNALGYYVEMAANPEGPWTNSWDQVGYMAASTNASMSLPVPMFFRVIAITPEP